jgi:hypothetical protein
MIWIAIGMFAVAYAVGGAKTVLDFIWWEDAKYLTLKEIGTIVLVFTIWPLARAYWAAGR